MTGYNSKRQATKAKLDDDDDTQVYADTLLIVYQRGFADGKAAAERKPLTDERVKELLLIGPVYAPGGVVTRTPLAYRKELLDTALWAFRKAEAAHNIKEGT